MPGEYVISVWIGTAYETVELLDDMLGFAVEGDDQGRKRRLVKLATQWRATRLDDHLLDTGDAEVYVPRRRTVVTTERVIRTAEPATAMPGRRLVQLQGRRGDGRRSDEPSFGP